MANQQDDKNLSIDSLFTNVRDRRLASLAKVEDEAEKAHVEMQIHQRRCQVVPMRQVSSRPFRSEIGIERTPIFVVGSFKDDWREYRRLLRDPGTDEHIEQIVRVGKKHPSDRARGVLKQPHQELFYKLLALWDKAGYPLLIPDDSSSDLALGYFVTSAFDLVRFVFDGRYSGREYARLRTLLGDLCSIPVVLEHHYLRDNSQDITEFTFLSSADWEGRRVDRETGVPLGAGKSEGRIVFSPVVTMGFLRKQHKPLLLAPYLSLGADRRGRRAELARLLYPLLDHELSRKPKYHCKLAALAERLGCRPQKYRSKRREQFSAAVSALDGLPILSEKFRLGVTLRESDDGTDWVLTAWRAGQESLPLD